MRLSHTVSQSHSSGSVKPQPSGAVKQSSVRPCVVFKIKPPKSETDEDEIDETEEASESEIANALETNAMSPAIVSD